MASIKNLKKEINDQIGDIIEDIYHWELSNPNENLANDAEKAIINISRFCSGTKVADTLIHIA